MILKEFRHQIWSLQFFVLCRNQKKYQQIIRLVRKRYRESGRRAGIPTFSEFVQFLLDPRTKHPFSNRHWKPYHELCKPCQVHYDFIGHLETIRQDAAYLLKKIGLQNPNWFTCIRRRRKRPLWWLRRWQLCRKTRSKGWKRFTDLTFYCSAIRPMCNR